MSRLASLFPSTNWRAASLPITCPPGSLPRAFGADGACDSAEGIGVRNTVDVLYIRTVWDDCITFLDVLVILNITAIDKTLALALELLSVR